MQSTTWRRPASRQLGLPLLALLTLGAPAAAQDPAGAPADDPADDAPRILIGDIHDCPNLEILGPSGQPIHLGRQNRGFLGVEATPLTPELRRHFGLPGEAGVLIGRVLDQSAAAAAGLAVGDILTHIDGGEIHVPGDLGRAVRRKDGGEEIEIGYWRDGESATATAVLATRERCAFDVGDLLHDVDFEEVGRLGLRISDKVLESLRDVDWQETFEGLQDIDWDQHFEGLRTLDLDALDERMESVQERLEELEEKLRQEQERLEELERDRRRAEGGDV